MSARFAFGTAKQRLIPPKPQQAYVKWYMNWADRAHKAVVLTCVAVTVYYGVGVVYMFINSRKNKGELRKRLIEAGVIDEDGRQLLHRLKDEDSWLGDRGVAKREDLAKRIEEKQVAAIAAAEAAEQERLRLEKENMDRTRVGIFDVDPDIAERNRRMKEDEERREEEGSLDPRVGVFYRGRETKEEKGSGWFSWLGWKSGEQRQVEAAAAQTQATQAVQVDAKEDKKV